MCLLHCSGNRSMSDFPNKRAKYDSGMKLLPIHFSWYSKLPGSYRSAPLASSCQHREQLVFGVHKQLPIFSVFVFMQQSEGSWQDSVLSVHRVFSGTELKS